MTGTSASFPEAWWEVAEVTFAIRSLPREDSYDEALLAYRNRIAGRKKAEKRLTARQFDSAVQGAYDALAGERDNVAEILTRARWALANRLRPVFARPEGWVWHNVELDFISECRLHYIEPRFIRYTADEIEEAEGPSTEGRRVNPWQRYPIPAPRTAVKTSSRK